MAVKKRGLLKKYFFVTSASESANADIMRDNKSGSRFAGGMRKNSKKMCKVTQANFVAKSSEIS